MSDPDAWAKACAEDLEAERARSRAERGAEPGSAAEEFRKLFEAVADKVSGGLAAPLLGGQAARTVKDLVDQARSAVEPVIERNPQVFDHLAAAGNELLAAYRSAVGGHEARWTRDEPAPEPRRPGTEPADPGTGEPRADGPLGDEPRKDDEGPGTGRRIDLD
ncbi:DUF5304 domain-containing protein [Streptomyces sp. NPDC058855]|uniref:DUF5304 domain-containing protein n=1 Tax=Streptomyces sp. NPDC058855 TaxID=3346651 RepID=UPI00369D008B